MPKLDRLDYRNVRSKTLDRKSKIRIDIIYTDRLDDLIIPRDIVDPFVVVIELNDDDGGVGGFQVTVVMHQDDNDNKTETTVSVRDDRLWMVQSKEKSQQALK